MKKVLWLAVLVIAVSLIPGISLAKKLTITPSIALKEKYNDNLYLTNEDREYDFITSINPQLTLRYALHETVNLSLNYGLEFRFYSEHSEQNATSISRSQSLQFQNRMQPLKNVFLEVSDIYRRVPIDNRANSVADNLVTNMTETNVFRVSPYIEYPLSPSLKTRFGYRYTNVWYRVDEGNNSETHSGFVSLKKQFRFGLNASLNYSYIAYRPQETMDDYDSNKVSVRANYQTARDFNIWGEIGRAEMDFKELPDEDVNFWNVGTNYTFRFSRSTSLGAAYSQSYSETELTLDMLTQRGTYYLIPGQQIAEALNIPEEMQQDVPDIIACIDCYLTAEKASISAGATESKRFDLFFKSGTLIRLFVNPHYIIEEEIQTDREDKTKGIVVGLSRPFGRAMTVSLTGLYANQEFQPEDENSDLYTIGLDLGYQISENIIATAAYRYNKKDSDFDWKDYYNNIAWIQARYSF